MQPVSQNGLIPLLHNTQLHLHQKSVTHQAELHTHRVGRRGLEPRTYGLKVRSSTIELATQGLV